MIQHADIAVYDSQGKLQLVVEIKNKPGASIEWVTQMRRNLLVHSVIPNTPYFLLALPDFFYLWQDSISSSEQVPPDYIIDTREALVSYIDPSNPSLDNLSEYGLELLVTSWLEDLLHSELKRDLTMPSQQWLFDSGLYEAIKNGLVAIQTTI